MNSAVPHSLPLRLVLFTGLQFGWLAATPTALASTAVSPSPALWTSPNAEHVYGLPETKPNQNGSLSWSSQGLSFASKAGTYLVPRQSLLAVSTGNERMELWGMKGRVLRMAIPYGGGIAMAGVMHHQVNALTVEFNDAHHGYHAAVFYLPAADGERALDTIHTLSQRQPDAAARPAVELAAGNCTDRTRDPGSVLVTMPAWNQAQIPASYRAFLYEHTVSRLEQVKGIGHVYREDETIAPGMCPAYNVHVSVSAFRPGSQVKRASMGPIGMFVGTTQMVYGITIADSSGRLHLAEEKTTTVRGEGESRTVADSVAKTIASRYAKEVRKFEQAQPGAATRKS